VPPLETEYQSTVAPDVAVFALKVPALLTNVIFEPVGAVGKAFAVTVMTFEYKSVSNDVNTFLLKYVVTEMVDDGT
jgi:hypothetical protein